MDIKKLSTTLLLAACTLVCGCNPGNTSDSNQGGNNVLGGIVNEPNNVQYVEGTLHDVNVDFDTPVSSFATNGKTNYKIVSRDTETSRAAGFISGHLLNATGATFEVVDLADVPAVDLNTQYVFVGCEDMFVQQFGGEIPTYDIIGVAGYQIQTVGKNVFINGYSENGYQMGAICFLRQVIGYDMFTEDCVVYEKDGSVLPSMDIVERPDFDYRQSGGASSNAELYGMGFTYTQIWINPNNHSFCHNWSEYVTSEDADANPDWASNDATRYQGCWTSRGNKDTYKGLVNHLTMRVKQFLKANPTVTNLMIAQHDIGGNTPQVQNCRCAACQASYEYYGGTMAGAWLSLCNRVSLQVDEWLDSQEALDFFGKRRDFNLMQLVYHASVGAPAEKDAAGNYILDEEGRGTPKEEKWFNLEEDGTVKMMDWDEAWNGEDEDSTETSQVVADWTAEQERVYCAPSVQLVWATSAADWVHPYDSNNNKSWADMVKAWSGFEGDFFVWAYALNSQGIFYPYNSFDSMFESTRFFKGLNAQWMFWQGNYQNPKNGGFEKLKRYLESKVEFDVNADYQHYVDKFFKYNFGAGGEYMQQYFEEVVLQCRYIEEYNAISGHIHNKKLTYKENWPEGLMNKWIGLLDKAYEAIEDCKTTDPEKYAAYKAHIDMESYFPRYVLITSYADSYKPSVLKQMRLDFLEDFYALGNMYYGEGKLITEVTDLWDLD